jgi:hypothetical protein
MRFKTIGYRPFPVSVPQRTAASRDRTVVNDVKRRWLPSEGRAK